MNQRLVNAVIRRMAYRTGRVGRPSRPEIARGPGRGSTPGRCRLPEFNLSLGHDAWARIVVILPRGFDKQGAGKRETHTRDGPFLDDAGLSTRVSRQRGRRKSCY